MSNPMNCGDNPMNLYEQKRWPELVHQLVVANDAVERLCVALATMQKTAVAAKCCEAECKDMVATVCCRAPEVMTILTAAQNNLSGCYVRNLATLLTLSKEAVESVTEEIYRYTRSPTKKGIFDRTRGTIAANQTFVRHRFEDLSGIALKHAYGLTRTCGLHTSDTGRYEEAPHLGISRKTIQGLQNIGAIDEHELIRRAQQALASGKSRP